MEIIVGATLLIIGITIFNLIISRHEIMKDFRASTLNQYPESINAEIKSEVLKGNKIKAIKLYRKMTGVGLKESNDYIVNLTNGIFNNDSINTKMGANTINAEIEREFSLGNNIKAIKLYRKMTGVGLKEAKDYIDNLSNRINNTDSSNTKMDPNAINTQIEKEISLGNKIKAIKLYRKMTGAGLKEAKDYIDNLSNRINNNGSVHAKMDPNSIKAEIDREISLGNKIKAIRLYRKLTGAGLKEAKDYIDNISNRLDN